MYIFHRQSPKQMSCISLTIACIFIVHLSFAGWEKKETKIFRIAFGYSLSLLSVVVTTTNRISMLSMLFVNFFHDMKCIPSVQLSLFLLSHLFTNDAINDKPKPKHVHFWVLSSFETNIASDLSWSTRHFSVGKLSFHTIKFVFRQKLVVFPIYFCRCSAHALIDVRAFVYNLNLNVHAKDVLMFKRHMLLYSCNPFTNVTRPSVFRHTFSFHSFAVSF